MKRDVGVLDIGSILGRPGQHRLSRTSTLRYGGNTPCVEVRCGPDTLIFDAGTGIRQLGNALVKARNTNDFDIFLSHGHIDHMVGLPFFAPLVRHRAGRSRLGGHLATIRRR
jgi:phosphoribosyl 1,2-cyclic phosphodiesterase